MIKSIFLFLTVIVIFNSCQRENDHLVVPPKLNILKPSSHFTLPSYDSQESSPTDIRFNQDRLTISFFDQFATKLFLYDYQSKQLLRSQEFEFEGPNGIGSYNRIGHFIKDDNSLFLVNNMRSKLFELDSNSIIRNSYNIRVPNTGPEIAFANPRSLKPLHITQNKAFVMGISTGLEIIEDQTTVKTMTILNLESGKLDYTYPRPPIYNKGQWGMVKLYNNFYDIDYKNNRLLCSFPIDHNVFFLDLETESISSQELPIQIFPNEFQPFRKGRDAKVGLNDKEKAKHYSFTQSSYYGVLYDPYKNYYYRMGFRAQTEEEFQNNQRLSMVLEVFDSEFNSKGIYGFPDELPLVFQCIFVTPDGLTINAVPSYEGILSFYQFNVL